MSANRQTLKHIRQSTKRSQARASGKTLHILAGNLVLLRDHPKGQNKIHNNYKPELFTVIDHHKDPNVYIILSLKKEGAKKNSQQATAV